MDALIKESRPITLNEIAFTVGISYDSGFVIVNDNLSYHKAYARWVPSELNKKHKWTSLRMSAGCKELSRVANHVSTIMNHTLNDRV